MRRGFAAIAELELPPGSFVEDEDGPLIWLSEDAPDPESVAHLRALAPQTGLWPVVVGDDKWAFDEQPAVVGAPDHPFATYSYTRRSSAPGRMQVRLKMPDAGSWLEAAWSEAVEENEASDYWEPTQKVSAFAPRGTGWPGLAPAAEPLADAAAIADWHCAQILDDEWLYAPRLALMPGGSSSEALAASWWTPPNTGLMAARLNVLRSWEQRFGTSVVALKPDTLYLSVAAPPTTREHAVHVACEHLAFCPDVVWQCSQSFEEHVERIVGAPSWSFWWD